MKDGEDKKDGGYKRKYVVPFYENPQLRGLLALREKEFCSNYHRDPRKADEIFEEAFSYGGIRTRCGFCGDSNIGHSNSCPVRPRNEVTVEEVEREMASWKEGFEMGYNGLPYTGDFSNSTLLLGYSVGQARRIEENYGDTEILHNIIG